MKPYLAATLFVAGATAGALSPLAPGPLVAASMVLALGVAVAWLLRPRRGDEEALRARADRADALVAFSRDLGSAMSAKEVAAVTARHVHDVLGSDAVVLGSSGGSRLELLAGSTPDLALGEEAARLAERSYAEGKPLGPVVGEGGGRTWSVFPLQVRNGPVGVLALAPYRDGAARADLSPFVQQAALALERVGLVAEAEAATLKARTEEMRSSLLSAVSHDLRTPLAAITGAASALREEPGAEPDSNRRELLDTICEEAEHLERLVENLLYMTRLEAGTVEVKREWVPLEEIVGAALYRLESRFTARTVSIDLPDDLPLVSADPVLLEQVFYNLLDNVAKYSPDGAPVEIRARVRGSVLRIEVADRGCGLPAGNETRIFEKFFRGAHAGVQGAGLGLAIAGAIVQAHGGGITGENRPEGGALFRIDLPLLEGAPAVELDEVREESPNPRNP